MGFLVLAKHGLNKTWDLRQIWSHFGGPKRGEEEEKRKREKKRKKERKRREDKRRGKEGQKGMELYGILKFCMNFHA